VFIFTCRCHFNKVFSDFGLREGKVITVIRTAAAFPGTTGEALGAKEIATIVKLATGNEQIVCTVFAGLLSDIAWIGQYDSVAEYDELRTKVVSDHDYVAAAKKARNLFVPGSERDQVWKHE
jgi:hypothetical protein